jgi:hypothetical protein
MKAATPADPKVLPASVRVHQFDAGHVPAGVVPSGVPARARRVHVIRAKQQLVVTV